MTRFILILLAAVLFTACASMPLQLSKCSLQKEEMVDFVQECIASDVEISDCYTYGVRSLCKTKTLYFIF